MYETLLRPHQVDSVPVLPTVGEVSARLKKAEQRREEKRLRQIANSRAGKRKRSGDVDDGDGDRAGGSTGKRPKTDDEDDAMQHEDEHLPEAGNQPPGRPATSAVKLEEAALPQDAAESLTSTKTTLSKTFPEVRGHTSYLTFACLLPADPSVEANSAAQEIVSASGTPVKVNYLQFNHEMCINKPARDI